MRKPDSSSARVRASSAVPRSVRSPQSSRTSATLFTCFTKLRKRPWSSSRQCRSADAATRIFPLGSRAISTSGSLCLVPAPPSGVSPVPDVELIVDLGKEIASADSVGPVAVANALPRPVEQMVDHWLWNGAALAWIGELKKEQMSEEDFPIPLKSADQAVPIHRRGAAAKNVRHVRAIEALALEDERFGPDHLLRGDKEYGMAKHHAGIRMLEPLLVHIGNPVP